MEIKEKCLKNSTFTRSADSYWVVNRVRLRLVHLFWTYCLKKFRSFEFIFEFNASADAILAISWFIYSRICNIFLHKHLLFHLKLGTWDTTKLLLHCNLSKEKYSLSIELQCKIKIAFFGAMSQKHFHKLDQSNKNTGKRSEFCFWKKAKITYIAQFYLFFIKTKENMIYLF